ncbi:hypothetical protein OH76DRAFT_1409196 [Lentinus brumalis]|uniref:Uncharacterized protein n=1 Tax=Lentinus brumalis TaxID=2498619 RepID=A0A371CVM9_9APHY|nr:hypothetical protein OH76DRAFT_1409196 [Polyporus brumalis]
MVSDPRSSVFSSPNQRQVRPSGPTNASSHTTARACTPVSRARASSLTTAIKVVCRDAR